jgi:hypothetical protein
MTVEYEFHEVHIRALEDKLFAILPEDYPEVIEVGRRTHGKPGYMAQLMTDRGTRGWVEFNARLEPEGITDLDIYDLRGFYVSKVDQNIFVQEPETSE